MTRRVGMVIVLMALVSVVAAACIPLGGTTGGGNAPSAGPVNWLYNWQNALGKAKTENKPLMVNFYTAVCPACAKLDRVAFADSTLATMLNDNFVNVKINAQNSSVARYYGVTKVPTNLFTTPAGQELGRTIGYRSPSRFEREATEMLNRWEDLAE